MMAFRKLICRVFGHAIVCSDRVGSAQVFDATTGQSREAKFRVHLLACSRCGETVLPIPQEEVSQ